MILDLSSVTLLYWSQAQGGKYWHTISDIYYTHRTQSQIEVYVYWKIARHCKCPLSYLRKLISTNKVSKGDNNQMLSIFQVMCTENLQERRELIEALHKNRKLSDLPRITQVAMIFLLLICFRHCSQAAFNIGWLIWYVPWCSQPWLSGEKKIKYFQWN